MSLIAVTSLVFFVSLISIQLLRPLSHRLGHVDRPGGRKRHSKAIPLCGGLAIVPVVIVFGALFGDYPGMTGLASALLAIMVLGVFDDRMHVPAPARLATEITIVVVFMCWVEGVVLHSLGPLLGGSEAVMLGEWAILVTVFGAVSLLNGINMIDGLDGVAGGFSVLIFGIFAAGAAWVRPESAPILLFFLAGSTAFLLFNLRAPWRRSASVFLGDAGSLSLGLALVWFAVDLSQGENPVFRPITMVWLFALPVCDTAYLVARRLMRGDSPFNADRDHFHHLLLAIGMPPGVATWAWLVLASIPASVGLLGEAMAIPDAVLAVGFVCAFICFGFGSTFAWRKLTPRRGDTAEATG